MNQKLCIVYCTAPRYREAIFKAIDNEYNCDWYFGKTYTDIKEMDLSILNNYRYYSILGSRKYFFIKIGLLRLLFKKDNRIFLYLTESRSITDYIFLLLASFMKRKKIYAWTHGWYGKESKIEERLKLWQFKHVDGLFLYGERAKNLLIDRGISPEKMFVIKNSLHYDQQIDLRHHLVRSDIFEKHFGNSYPVIIFIGRLTNVKRLDILVESIFKLREKEEKYNVVFVGDGEKRFDLEKMVERLNMKDCFWFYGASYDEVKNAELIYNSDLCVAPGNVGLTAMHTMVFGCPVISHNDFDWQMPEFEAIHPGETGDFFERDNVDSLVHAISGWFANNKNRREPIRQACYKEIDSYWNPYYQMEVIRKNIIFE